MSAAATEMTVSRLLPEEGFKLLPYDDATGKPVTAPVGNLSWGIGFNLMKIGSRSLFAVMLRALLGDIEADLVQLPWYLGLPDAVQSVCQDIAYNGGEHGFIAGYPHMVAALARGDLEAAANECTDENPHLDASRYAPLRAIIRAAAAAETGVETTQK